MLTLDNDPIEPFTDKTEFSIYIETYAIERGVSILTSLLQYCEDADVDITACAKLVTGSLKDKLEECAIDENLMLRRTQGLPFFDWKMTLSELDTFQLYLSIKTHFTSDYDFFKYRGRIAEKSCSYDVLVKKNYHPLIKKLSRTYSAKELRDYFLSNMLVQEGQYIFDIDSEGKRVYTDFIRRKESRTYIFRQDINRVCMEVSKLKKRHFWDSAEINNGQHPLLFRLFVGSFLSPETMCILYQIKPYLHDWDEQIKETILYPIVANQIKKLSPFIMIKDQTPFTEYIDSAMFNF